MVSAGAELDRDGSGFYITFVLDEGELFKFGTIDIESSLPSLDPQRLRGELLTVAGTTYDLSQVDKTTEKLTLVVAEQGYAFARVRPRANRDPSARIINVVVPRSMRARASTSSASTSSATLRTLDYVIRREFRLAEGDAYNPAMVDKAKKRLQALGFFKTVDIKRRQGSAPDRVILDVELVEQSTGELSFGAGYSTSEGVIGDVSITERNLLGKGQFLRLRLAGSVERLQVDLSFTEPRFLDRNLAAGFDLFHKTVDRLDNQQFRTRTSGGSVRLGFPLAENIWIVNSYTLSQQRDQRRAGRRPRCAIKEAAGHVLDVVVGHHAYLRYAQPSARTRRAVSSCRPASSSPDWAATCSTSARPARARVYYPDHRQDHLRRPGHRRTHPGLGRRGRAPARPLLQGRRDDPRLQYVGLRSARPADGRCAGRHDLLGDHGRGSLPDPVHPGRARHRRRRLRRCRLAVRCRRGCQEPEWQCAGRSPTLGVCLADSSAIRTFGRRQHPVELAARPAAPGYRQGPDARKASTRSS